MMAVAAAMVQRKNPAALREESGDGEGEKF
jgi:hypothetical protein